MKPEPKKAVATAISCDVLVRTWDSGQGAGGVRTVPLMVSSVSLLELPVAIDICFVTVMFEVNVRVIRIVLVVVESVA